MSDEPQTPSLRLKPRLHPEGESSATPAEASPAPESAPAPTPAVPADTSDGVFRLKLRPKSAEATPATPEPAPAPLFAPAPAPEKNAAAVSTEASEQKIRLKPRFNVEAPVAAANAQPAEVAPAAPAVVPSPELFAPAPAPAIIPALAPEPAADTPAPAPAEAPMRFKLKPKTEASTAPSEAATGAGTIPSSSAEADTEAIPASGAPPFPTVDLPKTAPEPVHPSKVPHIRVPESAMVEPEAPAPVVPPVYRKGFKIGVGVGAALGLFIIILALFLVWKFLVSSTPPPAPKAKAAVVIPAQKTEPASPASNVKGPIDRTSKLVSARADSEQVHVADRIIEAKTPGSISTAPVAQTPPVTTPQVATPTAIPPVQTPAPEATTPPPLPVAPLTTVETPPTTSTSQGIPSALKEPAVVVIREPLMLQPSKEFKRFINDLVIKGVFQGTPARAFVNGRLVQSGELADKQLQITFEKIDAEKKLLFFKDANGCVLTKKY